MQGAIQYVRNNPPDRQRSSSVPKCTTDAFQYTDPKAGTRLRRRVPPSELLHLRRPASAPSCSRSISRRATASSSATTATSTSAATCGRTRRSMCAALAVGSGQVWSWNGCSGTVTAVGGKDPAAGTTYGYSKLTAAMTAAQATLNVAANKHTSSLDGLVRRRRRQRAHARDRGPGYEHLDRHARLPGHRCGHARQQRAGASASFRSLVSIPVTRCSARAPTGNRPRHRDRCRNRVPTRARCSRVCTRTATTSRPRRAPARRRR